MNWRAIPVALKCALVLQLVQVSAWLIYGLADTYKQAERFYSAQAGLGFVIEVMFVVGALDLARTLTGRARIGAWIAFGGFLAGLVLTFVWTAVQCKEAFFEHKTFMEVLNYTYFATRFAVLVGLAIATDNLVVAIAGILVGVACAPPQFLEKPLVDALKDSGRTTQELVEGGMRLGHAAIVLVLAAFAARGEIDTPEPRRAVWGFRSASKAMWVRVFATCSVPFLTLFAVAAHSEDAAKLLKAAMVAVVVIGVWSMLQFALGALAVARSRIADMGRVSFLIAAGASLWCAGLSLTQFPRLFQMMYGDGDRSSSYMSEGLEAWSVAGPIIAIVAIALVVGGIAGFAGRRSLNDLHSQASSKGVAFVILMFATVAIQQWILPKATSEGSALFLILCTLVAALAGTVMMANLCTLAADSVEREPELPTATVV